jgi:hypothetical protein
MIKELKLMDVDMDLLKRVELKVENKLKMINNNMKVLFSPMPKELQVLMQIERGESCFKSMIMLLYGNLY